jgi:hypothetical protein
MDFAMSSRRRPEPPVAADYAGQQPLPGTQTHLGSFLFTHGCSPGQVKLGSSGFLNILRGQ